jgi:DNA-binding transcriptional LysR family regulator
MTPPGPDDPAPADGTAAFRVTFVAGVTLDKWRRRWQERVPRTPLHTVLVEEADQTGAIRDGQAHMGFVRELDDRDGLHLIPLYTEVPVVVAGREHPVAAYDEIPLEDLEDEHRVPGPDVRIQVETVAAGTGIAIMPMSVARQHHRRDVVVVPVTGLPETRVGLAWRTDLDDPLVETFIGIVRGRTERSTRGR